MRRNGGDQTTEKPVAFSRTKMSSRKSSSSLFKMKNIIKLSKIKNFKTKKIKQRIRHHHLMLLNYPLFYSFLNHNHHSHRKHLKYHPRFQAQFKYKLLQINQIIDSSSSTTFKSGGIPLVQEIISALQVSAVTSTSYFKMPLTIVLFLSMLITSHIANCQAIYNYNNNNDQRDNTYLFLSYYNKNNNLSVINNLNNKSLIEDSKSTIIVNNNKVTNYVESTSLDIIDYKLWPRKRKSHQPKSEYFNITPKTNISHRKYKTYHYDGDNPNALVRNKFLLNLNLTNQTMNPSPLDDNNEQLIKIVMDGLGLRKLPDFNKANISQLEYSTKYNEYLERIRKRAIPDIDNLFVQFENNDDSNTSLSLLSIRHNSSETKIYRERRSPKTGKNKNKTTPTKSIMLRFPLEISSDIKATDIEEANIRLLLITSPALAASRQSKRRHNHNRQNRINSKKKKFAVDFNRNRNSTTTIKENQKSFLKTHSHSNSSNEPSHFLNMKVYQLLEPKGKIWIDGRKIEVKFDRNKMDESTSQWLQFDVTKAVEEWLVNKKQNLGLEIQCDNCVRNGARIIDDLSGDSEEDDESSTLDKYDLAPVLNIIGRLGTHREKRSKHYHNQMTEKPKKKNNKSNCYKDNQRCCRHSMEVVFKEIKGFEFIIQPKVFDAGFCRGRCPPRYNPAHHHALLQSLIWKQDRKKVPRPCCAPSKLIELEVLHVDEKDNEKLKISTWTDMRVLECACS